MYAGRINFNNEMLVRIVAWSGVAVGLYLLSRVSYLAFHTTAETFNIIVSAGVFMFAWNTRRITENSYLLFLGIGLLLISGMDLLHVMTHQGMGIFSIESANNSVQLWIAARYIQAGSLLIAPWFITHRLNPAVAFGVFGAVASGVILSIFVWDLFPDCVVAAQGGLTTFKVVCKYLIGLILVGAIWSFSRHRADLDRRFYRLVIAAILCVIASELAFTFHVDASELSNLAGDYLKIVASYLFYRAVIRIGLINPYDLLFRELKESEARLHRIFAAVPIGIVITRERVITYVNESMGRMLKRDCEELVGNSTGVFYADQEEFERVGQALFGNLPLDSKTVTEAGFVTSSGEPIEVLLNAAPLVPFEPEKGTVTSVVNFTGWKRIEMALRRKNAYLDALFDSTPEAVAILDFNYVVTRVNPRFESLFGFTQEEAEGVSIHDLVVPTNLRRHAVATGTRASMGEKVNFESVRQRKDGTLFEARIIGRQIKVDNEEVGVYVLYRDLTERKRQEQELRQSEDRFRTLYNNAPLPFQTLDKKGNFVEVNQTWLDILGYSREEVIGRNFSEFLTSGWDVRFRKTFPKLKAWGEVRGAEYEMAKKDGGRILVSFHGKVRRDSEGIFKQIYCVFRDITEQRRMAAEKELLEAQLQQAHRMEALGTLAGGIAHDFNNILAAIMGFSELALEDAEEGLINPEHLRSILKSTHRARDLVKQILTFSRKAEVNIRPLALNREIENAIRLLRSDLPQMVELKLELAPDLPLVKADRTQMEQLLMNLGTNARDAMSDGGRITIRTSFEYLSEGYCPACGKNYSGEYVQLEFTDTGTGMSKSIRERLFEPFFTTKEVGRGTGLGLSTVYGIVVGHRGHINCISEPGRGTTFMVHLPPAVEVTGKPLKIGPGRTALPGGDETVLLVDDEPAILELAGRILTKAGYRVLTASTGEEALELYNPDLVDLVILDLSMPGMGGHQCLDRLLTGDPEARIIISTGYSLHGEPDETLQSGASGVIMKPYSRAEFLEAVRRALDRA